MPHDTPPTVTSSRDDALAMTPRRRRWPHRTLLAVGFLTLAWGGLGGTAPRAQAAADQGFAERTDVVAVEIPVQVSLDGEPVRGLEASDFEVLEARKVQPLVDFEAIDLSLFEAVDAVSSSAAAAQASSMPKLPIGARRHFLLLFDLSFSAPESIVQAQTAALDLVRDGLHRSDLVGVATYTSLTGPRLLLGFTSDRKQVALAIETLGLAQLTRPVADPLGLLFGDLEAAERGFSSGRGSDLVNETLEDFARQMERQDKRRYSEKVQAMTQSMGDLARLLRRAPGRKHVVFLSEGIDTSVFFGNDNQDTRNRQNNSIENGRVWEVDSDSRFGDSSAQNALEDMFREFRRADCRIDAVDIGGIQASTNAALGGRRATERQNTVRLGRQDGLATMASATGGELIRNHNDLGKAMAEVQRRTSVTYLLTIQPDDLSPDGKYRRLKVRLKDGPKGAKLTHRPGYFAPVPWQEATPAERQLMAASQLLQADGELGHRGGDGERSGTLSVALTATALPVAEAAGVAREAYVPLMVEIDGGPLLAVADAGQAVLEGQIFLYAMDGAGQVRAYLDHAVALDMAQAAPALGRQGLKFFGDLDLPPGDYMLRAFVRHRGSDHFGVAGLALRVPDFAGGEAGALPPLFPEPPGVWLMLREAAIPDLAPPPFPYLNGQQPFLPAARPNFAASKVDVALAVHNLSGGGVAVSGRVLDVSGREMADASLVARQPGPVPDADRPNLGRWPLELDARRLPVGDYMLEVTVTDDAGLKAVRRSNFRITP